MEYLLRQCGIIYSTRRKKNYNKNLFYYAIITIGFYVLYNIIIYSGKNII